MLLGVVAQSLKPVKLSATCKRTQQLPTMLRLFAGGFSLLGWRFMSLELLNKLTLSKALVLMTMKLKNVSCMLVHLFCDLIMPLLEITVNSFSLDLGTELKRALTPLSLIHLWRLCIEIWKKIRSSRFKDIQKSAKSPNLEQVPLRQVVRKRVSFFARTKIHQNFLPSKYYFKQHSAAT